MHYTRGGFFFDVDGYDTPIVQRRLYNTNHYAYGIVNSVQECAHKCDINHCSYFHVKHVLEGVICDVSYPKATYEDLETEDQTGYALYIRTNLPRTPTISGYLLSEEDFKLIKMR